MRATDESVGTCELDWTTSPPWRGGRLPFLREDRGGRSDLAIGDGPR